MTAEKFNSEKPIPLITSSGVTEKLQDGECVSRQFTEAQNLIKQYANSSDGCAVLMSYNSLTAGFKTYKLFYFHSI